ncbi:MAG TPA: hypothetical protein VK832_01480 [Burkholderiaceae bacterium]|nr:hypothetical protein [Burkholderiaceae bacterium]
MVLYAGAFGSLQLLQLSGIGAVGELQKFGIPVVHDLPGVGQNLRGHVDYVQAACVPSNTESFGVSLRGEGGGDDAGEMRESGRVAPYCHLVQVKATGALALASAVVTTHCKTPHWQLCSDRPLPIDVAVHAHAGCVSASGPGGEARTFCPENSAAKASAAAPTEIPAAILMDVARANFILSSLSKYGRPSGFALIITHRLANCALPAFAHSHGKKN